MGAQASSPAPAPQVSTAEPSSESTTTPTNDPAAAPFEFKPTGILSGRITDAETDQPVVGATVQIIRNRIFESQTDTHGCYRFTEIHEPGNFQITIESTDHVGPSWATGPMISLDDNKQAVRHFQLPKACRVNLQVVDVNGVGIAGAKVVPTSLADSENRPVNYFGEVRETNRDGRIMLGGFPPSPADYQITVWHATDIHVPLEDGRMRVVGVHDHAPARAIVELTDPNRIPDVQIMLTKGQEVYGFVEYADGVPATDVEISARPAWWRCNYAIPGDLPQEDGTFALQHIVPGTYDVCATIGGAIKTITQTLLPRPDGEPLLLHLQENSPQSLASICGRLIFPGERRPSYMTIEAYSSSQKRYRVPVEQGADGKVEDAFCVDRLEPGVYMLYFTGELIEGTIVRDVVAPSGDLEVELTYAVPMPVLAGSVVDGRTGKPVPSFEVRVRKLSTLRGPSIEQRDRWNQFDDEQGRFEIETVGPGVYQVQVVAKGICPGLERGG